MISSLNGQITYKDTDSIEITSGGVGYEVFVPENTYAATTLDEELSLFIYHHRSESSEDLYGFTSRKDRKVFKMLISVSGVGPKTALAVFDAGDGNKILEAVAKAETSFFTQAKGIGSKAAQRIIVDLQSKVGSLAELDLSEKSYNSTVWDALKSLGFTRDEISKALSNIPEEIRSEEKMIEYALKNIGKHE